MLHLNKLFCLFNQQIRFLFAISIVIFIIIFRNQVPGIYLNDSAEFAVGAKYLSIVHDNSYPFFLLLGKLFSYLPIDFPTSVNLITPFFATLTFFVLGLFIFYKTGSLFSGILAGLSLIFGINYYTDLLYLEVYSSMSFFILLMIILFDKIKMSSDSDIDKWIILAGFIGGIALGIHIMTGFFFPVFIYFIIKGRVRIKTLFLCFLFFLIGFSVYLYLPIRSTDMIRISWPALTGIKDFFGRITGSHDHGIMFSLPVSLIFNNFLKGLMIIIISFPTILLLFISLGINFIFKNDKAFFFALIFLVVLSLIFTINYDIVQPRVFLVPINLILSIFIGFGYANFINKFKSLNQHNEKISNNRIIKYSDYIINTIILFIFLISNVLYYNLLGIEFSRRDYHLPVIYGTMYALEINKDTKLLSNWNKFTLLKYLQIDKSMFLENSIKVYHDDKLNSQQLREYIKKHYPVLTNIDFELYKDMDFIGNGLFFIPRRNSLFKKYQFQNIPDKHSFKNLSLDTTKIYFYAEDPIPFLKYYKKESLNNEPFWDLFNEREKDFLKKAMIRVLYLYSDSDTGFLFPVVELAKKNKIIYRSVNVPFKNKQIERFILIYYNKASFSANIYFGFLNGKKTVDDITCYPELSNRVLLKKIENF